MTLHEFIQKGKDRLRSVMEEREAELMLRTLVQDLRSYSPSDLLLHKGEELRSVEQEWLENALERLENDEPLQHILGHDIFYGLELKCDRRALIPRPETEEMVDKAVQSMEEAPARILDLGTGNGCIALAMKQAFPGAEVHAVDLSQNALDLARENAEANELELVFHKDGLNPTGLSGSFTFDLVLSNPPYVAQEEREELAEKVRAFEPNEALFVPGEDPFGPYRSVLRTFAEKGKKGGILWMEINPLHADRVLELLKEFALDDPTIEKDLSGKRRFAFARR